jgi:hypothetical protein
LNNESLVEFILSHTELNTVTFLFLDFEINVVVVFKDDSTQKKTTPYVDGNPSPGLGQAQKSGWFKPTVWISQCTSMYGTFVVL